MEADWQRRRHPLHHSSPSSTSPTASRPQTLPSVAELIAASTPATGSVPAYHQPSSLPPILCSMQHNFHSPPAAASANAPLPAAQSCSGPPLRHAGHASPTLSAASEPHHYQQPITCPAEPQGAASEGYPSQQRHSPPPISGRRQDSAVSKEGSSFAPPSEPALSYSHRSPTRSHHSSSAPALSSTPAICLSPTSFEHVTSLAGPPNRHSHQPNTANPRQQRYNVRFAANYTSANMSSVQRLRQSPPLPAPISPQETNGPPTPPLPERSQSPVDPKILGMLVGVKKKPEVNVQPHPNSDDSTGEKCSKCGSVWTRTRIDASAWAEGKAKSTHDYVKASGELMSRLRQHEKDNEARYEDWKTTHSQCSGPSTSPPKSGVLNAHSNKRKSEATHSDMSKVQKITHDSHSPTVPLIRP